MKVSSVAEMRAMDRSAVETFGISEELLMENAALATCSVISQKQGVRGKRFIVFCGIGNNGGDGFAIARKLFSNGGSVTVYILGDVHKLQGAAKMNYDIILKMPLEIHSVDSVESIRSTVLHSHAIVDAIFGTGLTRDVGGLYRDVIQLINKSGKPVFSVDIPSGINGDTGAIMGEAVRAGCTVTFGLPKRGNMLYPGYELCGELYVTHISFPPAIYESETVNVALNHPVFLPPRDKKGHKGDFGDVLFIAGASNYYGAPYFAAMSFLKGGGGYARLAAPRSVTSFIAVQGSEIVFLPQHETATGSIALSNKDQLLQSADAADMILLGPGLSLNGETQQLVRDMIRETDKPLLLDGDGITAASQDISGIKERKGITVLTPHPGEMSRITQVPVKEIENDRIAVLQRTSKELNAIIVLKGAHSLIGYPDGRIYVNTTGNPGMATAGSGDVLTGAIAAMFGLGQSVDDAVRTGVCIHGLSGDLAAVEKGEDGITAGDIMMFLPQAVAILRQGGEILRDSLRSPQVV